VIGGWQDSNSADNVRSVVTSSIFYASIADWWSKWTVVSMASEGRMTSSDRLRCDRSGFVSCATGMTMCCCAPMLCFKI